MLPSVAIESRERAQVDIDQAGHVNIQGGTNVNSSKHVMIGDGQIVVGITLPLEANVSIENDVVVFTEDGLVITPPGLDLPGIETRASVNASAQAGMY